VAFEGSFQIFGMERSFFTRKTQAIFRVMGIDHEFRLKTAEITPWLEARAGTHLIPLVLTPEDWMLWDSTPIAFDMQRRFPDRSIIPITPVQRIACLLIEDWVDEWLSRAAVHSRWMFAENALEASLSMGLNVSGLLQDGEPTQEQLTAARSIGDYIQATFGARVCRGLGALEGEADAIRWGFDHQLDLLARIFESQPFLLGNRISLADAALIGSFVSHFLGDSEPRSWVARRQPKIIDWVESSFDHVVSGEQWLDGDALSPLLDELFDEIQREFHPHLTATHEAMKNSEKSFEIDMDGRTVSFMVVPYREASRQFIRNEILALGPEELAQVEARLGVRGLLDVYRLEPVANFHHQSPMGSRHPETIW